jgi:putative glycosyltransferase (TIGR04348 family)
MVDRPRIGIASPALADANNGNWHTAARWARHLQPLADVAIFEHWDGRPLRALIALHARKSADSVAAFRRALPDGRIVLIMTGTDLYRDLPDDPLAQQSLALADRVVVLQARALRVLPPAARSRAHVIEQSAEGCGPRRALPAGGRPVRFVAVGHLRDVKDPLTLARAVVRLADVADIVVEHIGAALDPALAETLRETTRGCPHYRWLGALSHAAVLKRFETADALVHPSRMEGGANVVIEAVRCGVPVLASAIDGNIGLLGERYEGYFPVGDDAALAQAMRRFAYDAGFAATLARSCAAASERFAPAREAAAVRALVGDLL